MRGVATHILDGAVVDVAFAPHSCVGYSAACQYPGCGGGNWGLSFAPQGDTTCDAAVHLLGMTAEVTEATAEALMGALEAVAVCLFF